MNKNKYAITFACYNQVEYTQKCVESMVRHGTPLDRLVVIDNGSRDSTREYLQSLPLGGRIFNQDNLGCGVAWNQGALALQAEWTIIMNNDILVSKDWVEDLIHTAEQQQLSIISPAMVEGPLGYDFEGFAPQAHQKMQGTLRKGWCHAVCLAIHKSVWMDIGYFRATPKLLGYEDALFFHDMARAGIAHGTTGASWIHHFGSITQSAMKLERGLKQSDDLAYRYNHRLLNQSWLERKLTKIRRKRQLRTWAQEELDATGMSLHGTCKDGVLLWD